ncbi:MAG: M20/M25/M40 family metallo-hydrolase [Clostridia bacterium]|nr:M20/M25/M40 family metallo-hydrolase [Clostridia bacterium]
MPDARTTTYAQRLSRMIQIPTVSIDHQPAGDHFDHFHALLRELFPTLFRCCTCENLDGSLLLCWKGTGSDAPIMLMHHHDVVEAPGQWKYPPFSGAIAEDKLWGRGTLDTKSGLFAILQAAEELAVSGYTPRRDIWFFSDCCEETGGAGADRVSAGLQARGIRFAMVLDEGGMILPEPIGGAMGTYAMVGLGEKGSVDLQFTARSHGGHASTPGKNTPLVRLGKFMAAAERSPLFDADISPAVCQMFRKLSQTMKQPLRFILGHPEFFKPLLLKLMPAVSNTAGAMLRTTLAFTMAHGSDGANVLPQEAWVVGNMRVSHHQGEASSIEAVRRLAEKYDIETRVLRPGVMSPITDHQGDAFRLVERAVSAVFPGVITSPYLMTAATDCRFMSRVCDQCLRFAPFLISHEQMASVHGLNENIDLAALAPAVDFYRFIITEA